MNIRKYEFGMRCSLDEQCFDLDVETWARRFECTITATYNEKRKKIGSISGWVIPKFVGNREMDLLDAGDAVDDELFTYMIAVVDDETGEFREDLNIDEIGDGVIVIHQVKIASAFRGYDLGLVATWHLLERLGCGRSVAVLKAHPLLNESEQLDETKPPQVNALAAAKIRADAQRLANYWRRMGFRPVRAEETPYMFLDLSCIGRSPKLRKNRSGK